MKARYTVDRQPQHCDRQQSRQQRYHSDKVIAIGSAVRGREQYHLDRQYLWRHYENGTTAPVVVSADGQLGTVASSQRFKKDIATMEKASEAILSLRPVTFHYKTDTKGTPQFGLIAEEVAKVNPALVLPDKEGKPYTVRYDAVNAMLLNEFLKEHKKVQEQNSKIQQQEGTIAELKSTVAQQQKDVQAAAAHQQKQIEALTVGLQRVSAQLDATKPAPQVVVNP